MNLIDRREEETGRQYQPAKDRLGLNLIPGALFCRLRVAGVGLTETQVWRLVS